MSDELLRAMAYAYFSASGPSDVHFGLEMNAMRAVLDVLHANGYRRCAEGRRVTQWCAEAERVRANLKALEDEHIAYADDVGDVLGQSEDEPLLTCARRVMAEVEWLRKDYHHACATVAQVHAAATGRPGEGPLRGVIEDAAAVRAERDALQAEVERLRGCRDELREIGKAIHDPRVHNTMAIAEWCDETQAELRRLKSGHCKDCCCARSWEALEITGYTGKSLPEEIEAIKADRDSLRAALEMVRDADDDCRKDGLPTISEAARRRIDAAIDAARGES